MEQSWVQYHPVSPRMRRKFILDASMISTGGVLLGLSILVNISQDGERIAATVLGIVLSSLAAWAAIPIEPYGALAMYPIVSVAMTLAYGLWVGVTTAAVGSVFGGLVNRSKRRSGSSFVHALVLGGESAVGLTIAYFLSQLLPGQASRWFRLIILTLAAQAMMFVFQLVRICTAEGVRIRRLGYPLARHSAWHQLGLLGGVILVFAAHAALGLAGVALMTIVFIELYYPWRLLGEQRDLFLKSLHMISNAVDVKDPYTAHHSRRVARYSVLMARALDVPEDEVESIRIGALMHDIGKMGVSGSIIRKPGKLTSEEMDEMKGHVEAGTRIVEGLDVLSRSSEIVRHHHENFDGTGYPTGLKGGEIPLGARIVFVADAFDALTTDRPYRRGRSVEEALAVLEANTRTQFDPDAVTVLKKVLKHSPYPL